MAAGETRYTRRFAFVFTSPFCFDIFSAPPPLLISRWLAEWLLENNPNKPVIAHADDGRPGDEQRQQDEAAELAENRVMGMVKTVESQLQE